MSIRVQLNMCYRNFLNEGLKMFGLCKTKSKKKCSKQIQKNKNGAEVSHRAKMTPCKNDVVPF